MKENRPNILLITVDQMRGDCLGSDGHPDVKTPYLDALALEGTRFTRAYTATPSCIAARAALMTGQSQKKHGRVGYLDGVPWDYPNMFPKVLGGQGYHTKAVGKMHVHPPRKRCGFDHIALHDGYLSNYRDSNKPHYLHQHVHDDYLTWLRTQTNPTADLFDHGIQQNSWLARPWLYAEETHPTNWVVHECSDFLKKRDHQEPFFLMASFVRPHPPFDAPQPYFDMYNDKTLRPPAMGSWAHPNDGNPKRQNYESAFATNDPEYQRQGLVGYYACITHLDHQIGRLLEALKDTGEYNNTIIIFTADHGELLFDHGMYRKVQAFEGSVRVPFLVKLDKASKGETPQPATCAHVVELRDIGPTLIDYTGGAIPTEMDGVSLRASLAKKEAPREFLHGEHSGGELSNHYIVTMTDKYIWYSQTGVEYYFDLASDPREETNLISDPAHQDRIASLRQHLLNELAGREEGYVKDNTLQLGRPTRAVLYGMMPEKY